MRGRPKRSWSRRANPDAGGAIGRTGVWPRIGADRPLVMVGNSVWRIKRRPVWNMWAAAGAAFSVAEGQIAPKRLPGSNTHPVTGAVSGYTVSDLVPGRSLRGGALTGATRLVTGSPLRPRGIAQALVERRKGAGLFATTEDPISSTPITKLPAFHRRLNATQPAVRISLQPFVHTRNGQVAQAKRRGTATIGGL